VKQWLFNQSKPTYRFNGSRKLGGRQSWNIGPETDKRALMVRISVASNVVDLLMVCRVCCGDILTAAVEPALGATCGCKCSWRTFVRT
jgi:hypothetical protein